MFLQDIGFSDRIGRVYQEGFVRTLTSKFVIGLLACVAVAGCESLSPKQRDVSSNPTPISVTNAAADDSRLYGAPGLQPVQQFPLPSDRDLRVMTTKLSGGAVEIYDLDAPASSSGGIAPVSSMQMPQGVPLASDPRVTVYPIDGGELSAGVYGGVSSYYPSEPNWSASPSMSGGLPRGSHVFFDHGSARVRGSGQRVVSEAAEVAKFAPVDRVSVEGHASTRVQTSDPIKGRILNLKESMNRAFEVSKDLIEQGVPAEKIKTVGWGDTKQIDGDEAAQRRVDIVTGQ